MPRSSDIGSRMCQSSRIVRIAPVTSVVMLLLALSWLPPITSDPVNYPNRVPFRSRLVSFYPFSQPNSDHDPRRLGRPVWDDIPRRQTLRPNEQLAAQWLQHAAPLDLKGPYVLPRVAFDPGHVDALLLSKSIRDDYLKPQLRPGAGSTLPEYLKLFASTGNRNRVENGGPNVIIAYADPSKCKWPRGDELNGALEKIYQALSEGARELGIRIPFQLTSGALADLKSQTALAYQSMSSPALIDDINVNMWEELMGHVRPVSPLFSRHVFILAAIFSILKMKAVLLRLVMYHYLVLLNIGMVTTGDMSMARLLLHTFARLPCVTAVGQDDVMWRASTLPPVQNSSFFKKHPISEVPRSQRPSRVWHRDAAYGVRISDIKSLSSDTRTVTSQRLLARRGGPTQARDPTIVSVIDSGFFLESHLTSRFCLPKNMRQKIGDACSSYCPDYKTTSVCVEKYVDLVRCSSRNLVDPTARGLAFDNDFPADSKLEAHGTVVSSLISSWDNSPAPRSICGRKCRIQPIKASSGNRYSTLATVLHALEASVNASRISYLGYLWPSRCPPQFGLNHTIWTAALQRLDHWKHVLVAPAGDFRDPNARGSFQNCPQVKAAFFKNVLIVSATDTNGNPLPDSNVGKKTVSVFAPGGRITAVRPDLNHNICPAFNQTVKWAEFTGTSFAAAIAAGVMGLVMHETNFSLTGAKVAEAIRRSSTPLRNLQGLSRTGGLIDAPCAVQMARYFSKTGHWFSRKACLKRETRSNNPIWEPTMDPR